MYVLGAYPRSAQIRKAVRDYDEGKLTDLEFQVVLQREVAYLCGIQRGAGLTAIQDPLLEVQDIFRPFIESWRNVSVDGLLRYFDNNFFYRVPVFSDRPDIQRMVLTRRARSLRQIVPDYRIKMIVPGPVTFSYLSRTDIDKRELAHEITRIYTIELENASSYRIDILQVDEPFLLDIDAAPEHYDLASECLRELKRVFNGKLVLALYFGLPRGECVKKLNDLPVEYVSLSLVEYPERWLSILRATDIGDKKVIVGVVNGRDIRIETYDEVKRLVSKLCEVIGKERIGGVTTSTWLDMIPLSYAISKTIILGQYGLRLREELYR